MLPPPLAARVGCERNRKKNGREYRLELACEHPVPELRLKK